MKGIILAGGSATRLRPLTTSNSKHLLPVYDKPMVYYPLSTLMLAGIRDILLITNPEHIEAYKKLLGDGNDLGININYKIQDRPSGIPEAFILGEKFIDNDKCCLILGDNLFFGRELESLLNNTLSDIHGAKVFCYQVKDPERYGVLEVNKDGKAISIKEKPKNHSQIMQ